MKAKPALLWMWFLVKYSVIMLVLGPGLGLVSQALLTLVHAPDKWIPVCAGLVLGLGLMAGGYLACRARRDMWGAVIVGALITVACNLPSAATGWPGLTGSLLWFAPVLLGGGMALTQLRRQQRESARRVG